MGRALGEFEQLILFALLELDEEAYGAAVGRCIEERTGRDVSPGAVYTALDRMEGRGLVSSWVGEPTAERGGRRRKHYRVTPEGATELHRSVQILRDMADGLLPVLEARADGGR